MLPLPVILRAKKTVRAPAIMLIAVPLITWLAFQIDAGEGVQQGEGRSGQYRGEQADPDSGTPKGWIEIGDNQSAGKGSDNHQSLEADIDNPRTFAEEPAQGGDQQGAP